MEPFLGSEALTAGRISRYELAVDHRRLLPGVYAPKRLELSLQDRIAAVWLWSRGRGVISGWSASALHGARWVDLAAPVEVNLDHNRSPTGVMVRRETILDDEVTRVFGMVATTIPRTAFDLARRDSFGISLQRLDALSRATGFKAADVARVHDAHPKVRGRRRVPQLLDLVDPGAQSPKETWLRLLLIEAGFPRPTTQIPVLAPDRYPRYFLDMGWEEFMVAAEYDGEQHRMDTRQYRDDIVRSEYLDGLGWRRIRVIAGDRREDIIRRVERAGVPRSRRVQHRAG